MIINERMLKEQEVTVDGEDVTTIKSEDDIKVNESDKPLSKMNTNELRDLAVSLGADKNKLYGTSKQALIIIIDKLKKENKVNEDTVKTKNGWTNKGKSGKTHGTFKTKKEADDQRKAMFANGYKG